MLFKNLFIENATEAMDIRVTDGKFEKIAANIEALPGEEVVDCGGKLALPPVIESHVHLDTCLTAGRPRWNMSGTLFEGIQCWEEYKPFLTKQEVKDEYKQSEGDPKVIRPSVCRPPMVSSMFVPMLISTIPS